MLKPSRIKPTIVPNPAKGTPKTIHKMAQTIVSKLAMNANKTLKRAIASSKKMEFDKIPLVANENTWAKFIFDLPFVRASRGTLTPIDLKPG